MNSKLHTTLTILCIALFSLLGNAQSGLWTLGINGGAAYQQSDICLLPGYGAGLTLGKNIYHRPNGLIDVDLRGRYLFTQTRGADHYRFYGIDKNTLLNGTTGEVDSYSNSPGFAFQNHKTNIHELSLEAVLTANRLREKTGIELAVFGGAGLDFHLTNADQQIGSNNYDYSTIDTTGKRSNILNNLNVLRDGDYESWADGYSNGTKVSFMPSAGIELGYQVSPKFSVGVAHRMTWALNDYLDGQAYEQNNDYSDNNDKYHYTNLYLRWKVGTSKSKSNTDFETGQTIEQAPATAYSGTQAGPAPNIRIVRPSTNPYTIQSPKTDLIARVKNVKSKRDIQVTLNGRSTNFDFDKNSGKLSLDLKLSPGTSVVEILAVNEFGRDEKGKTFIYEIPQQGTYTSSSTNPSTSGNNNTGNTNTGNTTNSSDPSCDPMGTNTGTTVQPPVVNISNPRNNPHETNNTRVNVRATIQNVSSANQIQFSLNGQNYTSFSFNPSNRSFSANINMTQTQVYVSIKAVNSAGEDTDTRTIILKNTPPVTGPACDPMGGGTPTGNPTTGNPTGTPPTVTISTPSRAISATTSSSAGIKATVTNVSSNQNIKFLVNGVKNTNFSFSPSTGAFTSTVNLNNGNNIVSITGTNSFGADRETRTINLTAPLQVNPTVKITTPKSNPYTSSSASTPLTAIVKNVRGKQDITVLLNGNPVKSFSFTGQTLNTTLSLNQGSNTVIVRAVNGSGSDSDTRSIVYHVAMETPVVTITTPKANPTNLSTSSTPIKATVLNVKDKRSIDFKLNGKSISNFTFNATTSQLTSTVPLNLGANTVKITATTAAGSDSDSRSINYTVKLAKPTVKITTPSNAIQSYTTASANIVATIKNITSANQVQFLVNGKNSRDFTYNTRNKTFTSKLNLNYGSTSIKIVATNTAGSAQDTRTLVRKKDKIVPTGGTISTPTPTGTPPTVIITRPEKNTINVTGATYRVYADITGITGKKAITFTLNGGEFATFTYDHSTGKLVAPVRLSPGSNLVKIVAVNTYGSNSDNATIVYNAGSVTPGTLIITTDPDTPEPPTVPTSTGGGVILPGGGVTPPAPRPKTNTTLGKGKTSTGGKTTGTKSIGSPASKPSVTVTSPRDLSFSTTPTATISGVARYISERSKLQITVNGQPVTKFNLNTSTGVYSANVPLSEGRNKIEVSGTNTLGNGKKSMTLYYSKERVKPVVFTLGKTSTGTKGSKKTVKAIVVNVKDKSSIQVLVNGKAQTEFTYNARTKMMAANIQLSPGLNTVEVVAKGTTTVRKSWKITRR